jgi:hypothetical protein
MECGGNEPLKFVFKRCSIRPKGLKFRYLFQILLYFLEAYLICDKRQAAQTAFDTILLTSNHTIVIARYRLCTNVTKLSVALLRRGRR